MKEDKETKYNTVENIIINILKAQIDKKDVKELIPILNIKIKYRMGLINWKEAKKELNYASDKQNEGGEDGK